MTDLRRGPGASGADAAVQGAVAGSGETHARRAWLARLVAAAMAPALVPARAQSRGRVQLAPAAALGDELRQALAIGRPLVVLVSLEGCPWCRMARDSYLGPLRDSQSQPVVQVDWGSNRVVRDLQGRASTHAQLVRDWGVSITPTVLFFGPGGREVAPRLVGGYLPDYYGAYLDERMAQARESVLR